MKLKELEDYDWFPKILRQFQLQMIGFIVQKFGVLKQLPPIINTLIKEKDFNKIVDLCSGSGFPSIYIQKHLERSILMELTDKFPDSDLQTASIFFQQQPVDVLQLIPENNCIYTMYNAWHHFTAEEQNNLLHNFKIHNATLLIVEIIVPSVFAFIQVVLVSTIGQLLVTPFIKPFSWLRLFFTYIVPVNLFTVLIDGIISVFKSKTEKQYQKQFRHLPTEQYQIEIKTIFNFPNKIITIIAKPIHAKP